MNAEKALEVNLITMRMSNHASHSGYDRLIDYIESENVFGGEKLTLFSRLLSKVLVPLINNSDLEWYNRSNFIGEIHACQSWLRDRGKIFHFLYGENSYRYLGNFKKINKKNAIVCTYHTPPGRFKEVVRTDKHLGKLDAIITVSSMQVDFLSQYTGKDRTFFVPHGIDVDYFIPDASYQNKDEVIRCLFVGSHLRDVETLVAACNLLKKWGKKYKIFAVTALRNKDLINKAENIELRMGVSDQELLQLYQQSDMLLLPLIEATANNSILEALACGLPIVSTELEGVKDYVNAESALLVKKHDAKKLAEAVVNLASDESLRASMRVACRKQAVNFSWESVAEKMNNIYKLVQP